jgi:predicted nucleotidyltransferase
MTKTVKEILGYTGNLDWISDRTVFLTMAGSHAYGTNTATSDVDMKGICIPPLKYMLGFLNHFEQMQQSTPVDATVFDIRKYFSLAADNNPNILEMLYTDPSDHQFRHPVMDLLFEYRDKFLCKKAKFTFSGYAISQLKRIKTHRAWLLNPVEIAPTREEFGLPAMSAIPKDQLRAAEGAIEKLYNKWTNFDSVVDKLDESEKIDLQDDLTNILSSKSISEDDIKRHAADRLGYSSNFMELLDRERHYNARSREYKQYQEWKKTRNPARAALEAKFGLDTKHASHLVRLLRMAREILTGQGVIVKRPDAEELLGIRNGEKSYEEIVEWAEKEEASLEQLYKESKLPKVCDRNFLDSLCIDMVEKFNSMS